MPNVLAFARPRVPTIGPDGIPDYITSVAGAPNRWTPPPGQRLAVFCDGVELKYIFEADRGAGWAIGKSYVSTPAGDQMVNGRQVVYRGRITFKVTTPRTERWKVER